MIIDGQVKMREKRICEYPPCNNEVTSPNKAVTHCCCECGCAHRLLKVKNCKQCGGEIDRKGFICKKCFRENDEAQHKKDNAKRGGRKKSDFEKKYEIPLRHDIVALAYGWVQ